LRTNTQNHEFLSHGNADANQTTISGVGDSNGEGTRQIRPLPGIPQSDNYFQHKLHFFTALDSAGRFRLAAHRVHSKQPTKH